ncbi:MAG: RsmB/NOP family class I SAM-dependent RNA methyltransferase [Betaproteobacteria bacterium]|nr:RsmB/NOP family class I SAM-dependent RNA methyltransferase [Betaproteobacteria bacterium]
MNTPQGARPSRCSPQLLQSAATALGRVLRFDRPADGVLSAFFREHHGLGVQDRAFVAESVYAVLRRKRLLERLAAPDPTPRRLLLAALVGQLGVNPRRLAPLHGDEAAWLGRLAEGPRGALSITEQADMPDWLVQRLLATMNRAALLELAGGLNQPAPLDLRVNALKTNREAVLAQFAAEGIAAQPCPLSPLGVRLEGKPALQHHALFLSGAVEVQDEGSQLLGFLLAPRRGEMVADFCAGAGGKTMLLGALMRSTGRLYAFDVAQRRLARLRERVARAGLSNVHPVCLSGENDVRVKRLAGKLDRVLVDAPCSGLGTLRRNPDLKWRQSPESIAEMTVRQAAILGSAARLVKPGGRLVYATCSILPEENEDIVQAFLATRPEFHVLAARDVLERHGIAVGGDGPWLRLLPHRDGTDGFFAAVLERQAVQTPVEPARIPASSSATPQPAASDEEAAG